MLCRLLHEMIHRCILIVFIVLLSLTEVFATPYPVLRISSPEREYPVTSIFGHGVPYGNPDDYIERELPFYADRSVPDVMVIVPEGTNPDSLIITYSDEQGNVHREVSGRRVRLHQRSVPIGGTIVKMPPIRDRLVLVKIRTTRSAHSALIVRSLAMHERWTSTRQLVLAILYGIFSFAFVVSIVFFLAFRDPSYLWYTAYLTAYLAMLITLDQRWVITSTINTIPGFSLVAPSISYIALLLATQFSRRFLMVSTWSRNLDLVYRIDIIVIAITIILGLLSSVFPLVDPLYTTLQYVSLSFSSALYLISGITASRRGQRYAKYYTAAWSTIALAVLFSVIGRLSDIDPISSALLRAVLGSDLLVHAGAGIEVILLTIGAASRLRDQRRSDDLLRSVLPGSIVDRMQSKETRIVDAIPNATVVFCDIVGFTQRAGTCSTTDLMADLETVFQIMDHAARRHGIEKIKTIGDAYMAVAGAPIQSDDHALRSVHFALDVLRELHSVDTSTGDPIILRIGIHSGPIVAGVIGTWKFGYDVWGQTVNIASRIESLAAPGTIMISAATAALLDPSVTLTDHGFCQLRGVGPVHCFAIEPQRPL